MSLHNPLIYADKTHRPVGPGEELLPTAIAVSARGGNLLGRADDGLYAGYSLDRDAYYVAASGVDDPASGSRSAPYKTLEYALDQLNAKTAGHRPAGAGPLFTGNTIIALKAGETFTISKFYYARGNLTLTFWGDPQYGDFDSARIPVGGGPAGADPAVMTDLLRPIIQSLTVGSEGMGCIASFGGDLTLNLMGLRIQLPSTGTGVGDYCNFVIATTYSPVRLQLYGTIVSRLDTSTVYGLFGMHARSGTNMLEQFASQLTYNWVPIVSGAPTDVLLTRANFIRFYKDFLGNIQSGGSLSAGSDGSALMSLSWSDVPSLPVQPGKTNLNTYPALADPAMGLTNYFTGLTRDNQQRPLNVISGRLF